MNTNAKTRLQQTSCFILKLVIRVPVGTKQFVFFIDLFFLSISTYNNVAVNISVNIHDVFDVHSDGHG